MSMKEYLKKKREQYDKFAEKQRSNAAARTSRNRERLRTEAESARVKHQELRVDNRARADISAYKAERAKSNPMNRFASGFCGGMDSAFGGDLFAEPKGKRSRSENLFGGDLFGGDLFGNSPSTRKKRTKKSKRRTVKKKR